MARYRTPSINNPYYLDKQDYIDTVRWCLRYPKWKAELALDPDSSKAISYDQDRVQSSGNYDPTETIGMRRAMLAQNIEILEGAIKEVDTDHFLYEYLLRGMAYGFTETQLLLDMKMPCSSKYYRKRKQQAYYIIKHKIL